MTINQRQQIWKKQIFSEKLQASKETIVILETSLGQ